MSFWSKIGLADAASVAGLKEEILSLRQENEELHEAQSKHMQQLCDTCTDYLKDTAAEAERRASGLEDQLRTLRPTLVSSLRDCQQEILSAVNEHREQIMHQLTVVLDNQVLLKESFSSAKTSREMALAQIVGLINDLKSAQEHARRDLIGQYSELSKASQTISDGLVSLKENADTQSSVSKRIVDQIGSGHEDLKKILVQLQF